MTDESPELRQPSRPRIQEEVPSFLSKVAATDYAFVYFSGHGFRDADGKLYLASNDCDPKDPTSTGVPAQWLREQLQRCPARFKLLIIDACHAGAAKGQPGANSVSAKSLLDEFDGLSGVVTLASSAEAESSLIWKDMEQSLFSYWLNQGLRGHADHDADGAVTTAELYEYVHRNVVATAEPVLGKQQTPVWIIGPDVPGVPVVIRPKPATLKEVLADMAQQLANVIQRKGVERVGITQFTPMAMSLDPQLAGLLGGRIGSLGHHCTSELNRQLERLADRAKTDKVGGESPPDQQRNKFTVVPQEALQKALGEGGFNPADLKTTAAKLVLVDDQPVPAFGVGMIALRTGRVITLQCQLIGTRRQDVLGNAGGTALLTAAQWSEFGASVRLDQHPAPVPPPGPDAAGPLRVRPAIPPAPAAAVSGDQIAALDEAARRQPHPLADPTFPYPVKITVGGRERRGKFLGNDYWVPLRQGEVYEIAVRNQRDELVWMRLLVDGLNTLPEKLPDEHGTLVETPLQRVDPEHARAWQLDPHDEKFVKGFYSQTGAGGQCNEFTVVDIKKSVIPRDLYNDPIGQITASFYEFVRPGALPKPKSKSKPRGVGDEGTDPGAPQLHPVGQAVPGKIGELQAVVTIHYAAPEAIQQLGR